LRGQQSKAAGFAGGWLFAEIKIMRTTLALDDDLIEKVQEYTGTMEKTALVRKALKALIKRESAKRLALLGGSEPSLDYIPRRQSEPK